MFTIFSYKITEKHLLISILLLAAILRFWGLGSAEFYHDEGFTAFRSIGYLDYMNNDDQTTPIQWFKDLPSLPWWTQLSFHDHPPLFFLTQFISFKLFGDSLFAARLPSAIAGVASIYLVYLLSGLMLRTSDVRWTPDVQLLKNRRLMPLFAAFLFSISLVHIWVSRSSLFESVQIFFILLNIYYFFRIARNSIPPARQSLNGGGSRSKDYLMFGLTLGLSFLTKYTSFFLIPVYVFYLFFISIFRQCSPSIPRPKGRDGGHGLATSSGTKPLFPERSRRVILVKDWRLYAAFSLAVIIFLPVIIYNIFLYKTVGHFDLQFAYLFNQNTPEWQASLGKIQDPFSDIVTNLFFMYSIPFLLMAIAGIGYTIYKIFNLRTSDVPNISAEGGSASGGKNLNPRTSDVQRFDLCRSVPKSPKATGIPVPKGDIGTSIFWLLNIIFITLMLTAVGSAFRFIALYAAPAIMLITFFLDRLISKFNGEILFRILITGFFIYELSFGASILWTFPDFGIVTLDKYFDEEFGGRRSLAIPVSSNSHLDKIIEDNIAGLPVMDKQILIIYDTNIALSPRLWLFTRRNYYHGIPVLSVDQFKNFLKIGGTDQFNNYLIYFVKAGKNTQLNPAFFTPSGEEFESFLRSQFNLSPVKMIYGYNNLLMFTVYKFIM